MRLRPGRETVELATDSVCSFFFLFFCTANPRLVTCGHYSGGMHCLRDVKMQNDIYQNKDEPPAYLLCIVSLQLAGRRLHSCLYLK